MELLMVGSMLLCALVGTVVGVKLLRIAARTRRLPEFAIGAALLAYAGLAEPSVLVSQILGEEGSLGPRLGAIVLRVLALYVGLLFLSLFTWRVFGADSRWRQVLAAGIAVAGLVTVGISLWDNWLYLSANVPIPHYRRLGMSPHFVLAFGWVSLESLRYHALMRKRRALGLADPVVANRFFVWGLGEGVASLLVLALLIVVFMGREISSTDPVVAWFVTLTGLTNALVWWISFAPPAAYVKWIQGNTTPAESEG